MVEKVHITSRVIKGIKEKYKPGSRIKCNRMPYDNNINPGDMGTVVEVTDKGHIEMDWDNGEHVPLIPGEAAYTLTEEA